MAGRGELRRLCDQLAATRDETLTLFPRFQKVVFNLWPELVRHVPEAEGLLAPLNKAWDDWVTFDYRLATFRARVQDALERKTSQVQIGFWVDRDNQRRAHSISRVGKALDALESLVKILMCGSAMASLRIDGSDAAGPNSPNDDRITGETQPALKQLELLVGEITM
ncbi:hypothetical protein PG991_008057 [Apiospora marii]|uniref:Dynein heavy chain tail domain-containing protein n=1 Tax=Apiospora marii TaxID=335849 RepID=A0ABR1RVE8_9PEZI